MSAEEFDAGMRVFFLLFFGGISVGGTVGFLAFMYCLFKGDK